MTIPKCPRCNTNKHARPNGQGLFYCQRCKIAFDGEDDGTTTYGDPARIAERNERMAAAVKVYQHKLREQARLKGGLGK